MVLDWGIGMIKMFSRIVLAAAAASMAMTPIAAQAGTRAGDSTAVYSAAAAPGIGRSAEGESLAGGSDIIIALLAAAAIIAGLVLSSDSEDNGQSPGT